MSFDGPDARKHPVSRGTRGVLVGCGVVLALGVVAAVAMFLWFRAHGDELVAEGKAAQAAGAKAGATLMDGQCVDAALADYARDRGMLEAVQARLWLGGCLDSARPTQGFCVGVPEETAILRSAAWRVARCDAHHLGGDSTCPNILAEVQKHCAARGARPAD